MMCLPTSLLSGFFLLDLFAFAPPNEVVFFDFLPLNELALFAFLLFDGLEAAIWLLYAEPTYKNSKKVNKPAPSGSLSVPSL